MSRKALVISLASLLVASILEPAFAQQAPACVKRTALVDHLSKEFKEAPVAIGIVDNGALLEVFSTVDGATWTVAVTTPNGITCLVATGQSWEDVSRMAHLGPPA